MLCLGVAPSAAGASACAQAVIADWSDGRVDREYRVACYKDALLALPEDLRVYGTARSDLQRRLTDALGKPQAATRTARGTQVAAGDAATAASGTGGAAPRLAAAIAVAAVLGATVLFSLLRAERRRGARSGE